MIKDIKFIISVLFVFEVIRMFCFDSDLKRNVNCLFKLDNMCCLGCMILGYFFVKLVGLW